MALLLSMQGAPTGYRKHNEAQNISHMESHTLARLRSIPDSEVPAGDSNTPPLTAERQAHPLGLRRPTVLFTVHFRTKLIAGSM